MILISKLLFGSAAAATLAGSVVFSNAIEVARDMAASMRSVGTPEAQQPQMQQTDMVGDGSVQLPHPRQHWSLQHCPGQCDLSVLLSSAR